MAYKLSRLFSSENIASVAVVNHSRIYVKFYLHFFDSIGFINWFLSTNSIDDEIYLGIEQCCMRILQVWICILNVQWKKKMNIRINWTKRWRVHSLSMSPYKTNSIQLCIRKNKFIVIFVWNCLKTHNSLYFIK